MSTFAEVCKDDVHRVHPWVARNRVNRKRQKDLKQQYANVDLLEPELLAKEATYELRSCSGKKATVACLCQEVIIGVDRAAIALIGYFDEERKTE